MAPGTPDLLPGTLDLLILRTLQKDALHGWAISERIQHVSEGVLQVYQGSLYPALHRLERKGFVDARWETAPDRNREFKYYSLTDAGRKQLVQAESKWKQMASAIGRVMWPGDEREV